jgi:uncharacterized protein (TIRG00374 family)
MRDIKVLLGLLCAALFLYLAVKEVDLWSLQAAFSDVDLGYVLLAVAVSLATYWLRAWRWQIILRPVKEIRLPALFAATVIGFMANNILPFRVGEIGKAFVLSSEARLSLSATLATVVVERAFDSGVIAALGLTLFFLPMLPSWVHKATLILLTLGFLSLLGLAVLTSAKSKLSADAIQAWLGNWKLGRRLADLLSHFAAGAEALRSVRAVLKICAISVVLWGAHVAIFHFALLALGIELPLYAAVVVFVFTAIGVVLPSAPGYIGTFQYFTILALTLFSVPKEQALSYAILAHVSQWAPVTVLGLVYVWGMGLRLSDLIGQWSGERQKVTLQS